MRKTKMEITAETVSGIINEQKLTSLTQVSKALNLGKGSISGSVSNRLKQLVPDIEQMLAQNKTAKGDETGGANHKSEKKTGLPTAKAVAKSADKPATSPQATEMQDEGESICPFRRGSKYGAIWLSLYRHRKNGITRKALVEEIISSSNDFADKKTCDYAITVVASPNREGGFHRSASRAADVYWIEKAEGGNLTLHLRNGKA